MAGLSKKLRFEVFKRDSFTCQYCGHKAPDVILQIDHIQPRSGGGSDGILNLITSCVDCNAGKSDRTLSDQSTLAKQRAQLEALQERKEQLEMLLRWKKQLFKLDDQTVDALAAFWAELANPFRLTQTGLQSLKRLARTYSPDETMEAMRAATDQYFVFQEGQLTAESVERAWDYVPRILRVRRKEEQVPYFKELLYIRGILRNRLSYFDPQLALSLLEEAAEAGADIDWLKNHAKQVRNWSQWRDDIQTLIHDGA